MAPDAALVPPGKKELELHVVLAICLPAPQVANFFSNCLIVRMLSSTDRIDELRSSDGIMHCLLRCAFFI